MRRPVWFLSLMPTEYSFLQTKGWTLPLFLLILQYVLSGCPHNQRYLLLMIPFLIQGLEWLVWTAIQQEFVQDVSLGLRHALSVARDLLFQLRALMQQVLVSGLFGDGSKVRFEVKIESFGSLSFVSLMLAFVGWVHFFWSH